MSDALSAALVPLQPATMLQSLDSGGSGLRVAFYRLGDRHAHVIAAVQNAGLPNETVTPLLRSHEGTDAEVWPPSPPLQSLSIEQRPGGAVALLVGMAGKSHWSMSVEAFLGERRLVFDIACRTGGEPARLGSTYRREPGATSFTPGDANTGDEPFACYWATALGRLTLRPTLGTFGTMTDAEIALQAPAPAPHARSRRWAYTLELIRS